MLTNKSTKRPMPVCGVTYYSSGGNPHKGHISTFPSLQILGKVIRATLLRESLFVYLVPQATFLPLRISDGWTTADVEYKWKQPDPVQFAKNLFLPGGFELTRWVKTDLLRALLDI